ncbi:hypothetical protein [Streptomyces sp. NPDC092370]|uniref:hypothetical protein n=1 Tax=Streptomyces sp. NPDC092370 TaxID=3366016 RepID=UPI003804B81A
MDTTQNRVAEKTTSRAMLVTLLIFGCGNLGFLSGIFAGVVGKLSLYTATATGGGAFLLTLGVAFPIMSFVVKGNGA